LVKAYTKFSNTFFYQNVFISNLSPVGSAIIINSLYARAYMFHNLFIKNVAAAISQSLLFNFKACESSQGSGINIFQYTDMFAYNETYFDNFANMIGLEISYFNN